MSDTKYFIDGKDYSTEESELTLAELLASAGLPVGEVYLKSKDGHEFRDAGAKIPIHDEEEFTSHRIEHYGVNGEELEAKKNPLTVEEILKQAGKSASIDVNELDSYYLESISGSNKYENLSDLVPIKDGDEFLAVHTGSTPVA